MNELEDINLHEHLVRKSVAVLLLKGLLAWGCYYLVFLLSSWLLQSYPSTQILPNLNEQAEPLWLNYFYYFWPLLFGLVLLYLVLSWIYEYYIFKLDRIILRTGILFSREEVYETENIHKAEVFQGLLGKILDTGTLKIHYGARGIEKTIWLKNIPRPYHVAGHMKKPSEITL